MPDQTQGVFKILINAPIEDIWKEITRSDDVIPCFFNMRMHAGDFTPGTTLTMRTKNGKYVGVIGKVLEFSPPHRFAHTFKFTQLDDPECKVIYDLRQLPSGVEFTLTIQDLVPGTKTAKQMTQGGTMIVKTLKSVMETGRPSLGIRALYVLFKVMEPLTPKKCRAEHWT